MRLGILLLVFASLSMAFRAASTDHSPHHSSSEQLSMVAPMLPTDSLESCEEPFVIYYGDEAVDLAAVTVFTDSTHLFIGGMHDGRGMVLKMTFSGDVVWVQTLQAYNMTTYVTDLKLDSEGMLIGCGHGREGDSAQSFAFKMDPADGALSWSQTYGGTDGQSLIAADIYEGGPSANYILMGEAIDNPAPGVGCDASFYTIDRNTGLLTDNQVHANLGSCEGFAAVTTANGLFYGTGRFNFANDGDNRKRPAIMAMDPTGTPVWSRLYLVNVNTNARLRSSDIAPDGNNFIILIDGDYDGVEASTENAWLLRANAAGGAQWALEFTFPEAVISREVVPVGNGYLVLVHAAASDNLYITRVNGAGEVLWARVFDDHLSDVNGDELLVLGDQVYLAATLEAGFDGFDKIALYRMNLETGALPEACVPAVPVTVEAEFLISPYGGFNAITLYNSPFESMNSFPAVAADVQPLEQSCGPDCEEDCETLFIQYWGTEEGEERGGSLVALPNGNVMLGGAEGGRLTLMEFTPNGELVRENRIQTEATYAVITDLEIDSDGMLIGAAREGLSHPDTRGVAFRYDYENETLLWYSRTPLERAAYSVLELGPDGDILFSGSHLLNPPAPGYGDDISWQTLDRNTGLPTGTISANMNLGGPEGFNQTILHEGKIYNSGRYSLDDLPSTFRAGVSRFDLNGNEEWSRLLHVPQGSSSRLYARDLDVHNDELYVMASGDDDGSSTLNTSVFLYKMSLEGELLWAIKYEDQVFDGEDAREMIVLDDGLLILGEMGSNTLTDFFLYKVDFDGQLEWARLYHNGAATSLDHSATSQMIQTAGGIFITATNRPQGPAGLSGEDLLFARTNEEGLMDESCMELIDLDVSAELIPNAVALPTTLNPYDNSLDFNAASPTIDEEELPLLLSCANLCEELCDNGIDDDGDGLVDCEDPDVSNSCCCYEVPVLELGADTSFCDVSEYIIEANEGFETYEWSDGSMESSLSITESGEYWVMAVDSCGNAQSDTIVLSLEMSVETSEEISLCDGETIDIFGQAVSDPGIYTATFGAANGCDSTHTVTVEVIDVIQTMETINLCEGETVEVFGMIVDETGHFMETFTSSGGCDSIHQVAVIVEPTVETEEHLSLCEGETVEVFGQVIGEAGIYTETFEAANGCDSTHTVTVTVSPVYETTEEMTICEGESVDIFGQSVSEAGTYSQTFTTEAGCDSVITIELLVLPSVMTSETIDLCEGNSILLFGQQVTQAGDYSGTFTGANGCDSTHTVSVNVLTTIVTEETLSGFCPGEVITVLGQEVVATGEYSETYTGANGCDSTHIVNVIFEPKNINLQVYVICPGESIEVWGQEVSTPGTFTQTFTAASGCDSTEQVRVVYEEFYFEVLITPPLPGQQSYWVRALPAGSGYPYTYQWSFTDLEDEIIFNVPLGEHTVTVTSVNGCVYEWPFEVDDFLGIFNLQVDPVYIPNAFSPNYDGVNDFFGIYAGKEVKSILSLQVFSRWGEPVFENSDFPPNRLQLGWDGRFRGREAPPGVYVYTAEIELEDGEIIRRSGDVVLIR